jgi:hypothetical protein
MLSNMRQHPTPSSMLPGSAPSALPVATFDVPCHGGEQVESLQSILHRVTSTSVKLRSPIFAQVSLRESSRRVSEAC